MIIQAIPYKPYYNSYDYNKNNLNKNDELHNNVSFEGAGKVAVNLGLIYASLCGAYLGLLGMVGAFNSNGKELDKNVGWDNNIRVLAGTGQNTLGTVNEAGSKSYSLELIKKVPNENINTIEKANDLLSKKGYDTGNLSLKEFISKYFKDFHLVDLKLFLPNVLVTQIIANNRQMYSLETFGKKLEIFNTNKQNKNRYVLALYSDDDKKFSKIANNFSTETKKIYKIPDENILILPISSFNEFKQGIDSITKKFLKLKNINEAELLILYSGHGDSKSFKNCNESLEGSMEGIFQTKNEINESQIKELFHEKLNGIKTLFIIDACHSGAWIAKETESNIKKIKLIG